MSVVQIVEAGATKGSQLVGKIWSITIIEGDRQGSSAYYPKEALESGAPLFKKGLRIFKNHPSSEEKWSRPERNVDDIIGVLDEDATFDGKDLKGKIKVYSEHQEWVKERAEDGVIAMSIRAEGQMTEGANGMELVRFTAVRSVDVVTEAGAGGKFEEVLESAREISAAESAAESQKKEEESEMDPKLLAALDALVESNKKTTEGVNALLERAKKDDEAKEELAEAERKAAEEAKTVDPLAVAAKLAEAKLTAPASVRVLASVKAGTELEEAIKAEQDYVKSVLEEAGSTFVGHETKEIAESVSIGGAVFGGE
jgi:hypothetical protein